MNKYRIHFHILQICAYNTHNIIDSVVRKSLINSGGNDKYFLQNWDPIRTFSMPIRWGDKCWNSYKDPNVWYQRSEMYCFTDKEHMFLAKTLKHINRHIDTLIITSETENI